MLANQPHFAPRDKSPLFYWGSAFICLGVVPKYKWRHSREGGNPSPGIDALWRFQVMDPCLCRGDSICVERIRLTYD